MDVPLINGQFQPEVVIEANKWYRLRLVNSNGQFYTQLKWPSQCEVYLIAADGIYFQDGPRYIFNPIFNTLFILYYRLHLFLQVITPFFL